MPAALGRVNPTARTPAVSILTVAFIGALLAVVGSYDRLSSMATFGNLLFFALNAWGLIQWPVGKETSIRSGIGRCIPWIFLAGSVWLLVTVVARGSVEIVWALVLIGAGVPVYLGIRAARRGR
jgi:amino acid transporter